MLINQKTGPKYPKHYSEILIKYAKKQLLI